MSVSRLKIRTIARRPELLPGVSLAADEAILKKDRHATAQANPQRLKQLLAMGLLVIFFALPKLTFAKTLQFGDQTWEVVPSFSGFSSTASVRSDFDLTALVKNSILGSTSLETAQLLSETTTQQLQDIAKELNQQTEDAKLVMENNKATEFNPGQDGQVLDLYETVKLLSKLSKNEAPIILPVVISTPKTTLSQTNNLGINELVAVGESNFTGSPNNRIHNIKVGAAKFDGIIVAPDEEFSFNKYLGEVDGEHGFLPELVIKPKGVIPEFGGGLCQVSTTTFRAAMNAGLPITARRNHSFAVQYYSPQGTDATIYPGASDLKFVNNLPSAILIHTKIIGKKLYFEYYGTKDARQVSFEGPVIYDKKSDGSMKATWTRHVVLNDQATTTQVFNSTYLPPALFHPVPPPAPVPPVEPVVPPTPVTQPII